MHGRPRCLRPAALDDCLGHALPAGSQDEAAAVREYLWREITVPGCQIIRRVKGERFGIGVDPEAEADRFGGRAVFAVGVTLSGLESMQGRLAVIELASEQGAWGRWRSGRRGLGLFAVRLQKHREQAFAFARLRGQVAIKAAFEVGGGFSARDGSSGELLLLVDVMHVHEDRRVADVLVGLFVLFHQHFEDAGVAPDRWIGALGQQVDDYGRGGLAVAVHPAVALLEDHQGPGQVEVDQAVALVVEVDALGGDIRAKQ